MIVNGTIARIGDNGNNSVFEECETNYSHPNNTVTCELFCGLYIGTDKTHLLIQSARKREKLEAEEGGRSVKLVDFTGAPPDATVTNMEFTDEDEDGGLLAGTVYFDVPMPEPRDIKSYRVYWQARKKSREPQMQRGSRPQWLAQVEADGIDQQAAIVKGSIIPPAVRWICVVATNVDGEAFLDTSIPIFDFGSGSEEVIPSWQMVLIISASFLAALLLCSVIYSAVRSKLFSALTKDETPDEEATDDDQLNSGIAKAPLALENGPSKSTQADTGAGVGDIDSDEGDSGSSHSGERPLEDPAETRNVVV